MLAIFPLLTHYLLITDAERRHDVYGHPMHAPFLEDCRLFLHQWKKELIIPENAVLYNGRDHYITFNEKGFVEFYDPSPTILYAYEIPCDSYLMPFLKPSNKSMDINFKSCDDLYTILYVHLRRDKATGYEGGFYKGSKLPNFCFSMSRHSTFPSRYNTPPSMFASYRIRPSRFYVKTKTGGKVFKPPTFAAFKRLLYWGKPVIDDGTPESDYAYDYWD